MQLTNYLSKTRLAISLAVSTFFVFISFNFDARNIAILNTRSTERIFFNYVLNILLFFVIIYLIATVTTVIYRKIFKH